MHSDLKMAVHQELAVPKTRVQVSSESTVVLVRGNPVNHALHIILTILTCLFWGIGYAIVAVVNVHQQITLTLDEYGVVQRVVTRL